LPGFPSDIVMVCDEAPTLVLGKVTGLGLSVAWGADAVAPVPVIVAVCGDPVELSATETLALRIPVVVGVKVMVMMQLSSTPRLVPQLLVWEKLLALAPVIEILEMVMAPAPTFSSDIVIVCDEAPTKVLGKLTAVGLSVACGAPAEVPVPVKVNICGEFEALSAKLRVAVRVPVASGVKVNMYVQLAPAASVLGHVCVAVKSEALVPPSVALLISSDAPPGLEIVMPSGAEVVLICWLPKGSGFGFSVSCGAVPVPVSAASVGEPDALLATEMLAVSAPLVVGLNRTVMAHAEPAARVAGLTGQLLVVGAFS
jgi:hypothetical protein